MCNNDCFTKTPLKIYLPHKVHQFTSAGHYTSKQVILLGPPPSTKEPRKTIIKSIKNKAHHKVHHSKTRKSNPWPHDKVSQRRGCHKEWVPIYNVTNSRITPTQVNMY